MENKNIRNFVIISVFVLIGINTIYANSPYKESHNEMRSMMDMMNKNNMNSHDMMSMMSMGDMNMMGNMMHVSDDSGGMMSCMNMMKGMSKEEKEEMLKSMDKYNDGECDICSMSIEMCRQMMN